MAVITIGVGGTETISQDETDSVTFLGLGTLNVTGTPDTPINVSLSQVGGTGILDTINIADANVTLNGAAGTSALLSFNIGGGGRLNLDSTLNVAAGSNIAFTAPGSRLVLGSGTDLSLLSGISGFGPGTGIEVSGLATDLIYTDAPDADTGGVITLLDDGRNAVGTIKLITGEFSNSSFNLIPEDSGSKLLGFEPFVTGVTASPAEADLGIGNTATFTLALSTPVTVAGGTPTLTLNDGGVATYDAAASGPTSLVFTHTVAAGQNAADLAITGVALNGATASDTGGDAVNFTAAAVNPLGTLQVDGTTPTVTGIARSPSTGLANANEAVTVTLTISEAVAVAGGTPTLALSDGGTAAYDPANSTPTSLAFTYTPAPGQDLSALGVNAANLNGATIADGAGNAADLSGAVSTPAPSPVPNNFHIADMTTNSSFDTPGEDYSGPVKDIQHQYISVTADQLNIVALTANAFIHSGSATDAIDVSATGGTNVLDGGAGSNFLVGGTGADTFFVDNRTAAADVWSTVANFHTNDAVTLYGVNAADFAMSWEDNQGAAGYTGLTMHAIAAGKPIASMTIAGYSSADLGNGKLTVSFGNDPASESNYLYVHGT